MRVRIVRFQGFTYKVTRNTVHRWDRITASWPGRNPARLKRVFRVVLSGFRAVTCATDDINRR